MGKTETKSTTLIKVFLIYLLAVAGYAVFVRFFSIPVHVSVDEELYISMAKSFHYEGVFSKGNNILDYDCVLYSMLLSIAWYVYSPENIMFFLRLIGVCAMLTSVFPIYLLSSRVLGDKNKAFKVTILSCFLPSMMNVAYCMQEVLSYPLFLWVVYFVYREIEEDKICEISKYTWGVVVLSVAGYFTKTYMIFLPVAYVFLVSTNVWLEKRIVGLKKIVLYSSFYFILLGIGKRVVLYINEGITGANHYSSQFAQLFPITEKTIIAAITCMIFYAVALCFYWGVLPVVLPISNWKMHNKKERNLLLFILISLVVLIAEIVISIVLTEEGNVIFPHKVLYRYYQILEIPILLIFYKCYKKYKIPNYIWGIYSFVLGILMVYYIYIGKEQRTAIIDAPLFLLMENVNRHIIPYFNILICICCAIFLIVVWKLKKRGIIKNTLKYFIGLMVFGVGVFFLINLVQLPLYTNAIAQGNIIEADAIKIADFCEKNNYDNIYMILSSDMSYERSINAYLRGEITFLNMEEIEQINQENSIVICGKDVHLQMNVIEQEIDTQKVRIYKPK